MGFDITLVDRLGAEFPFHDNVGLFEPLVRVAQLIYEVAGDVGRYAIIVIVAESAWPEELTLRAEQPVVEDGRVRLHGFFAVQNGSQDLVIDFDEGQRGLGGMHAVGRHRGHGMAFVQRFVGGQHVVA